MSSPSDEERGSVSAFVACVAASLVLCGMSVLESGRFACEYLRVSDVAENASRIGAQSIVGIRAGNPRVDQTAARTGALTYMRQQGVQGSVAVTASGSVEVHARVVVPLFSLSFLGVRARSIEVIRGARTVDG